VVPSCRVNPNYANLQFATTSQSRSWYNALQVGVQKRLTNGLQFQSAYTWSKVFGTTQGLINNDSSAGTLVVTDPNHPEIDRGPALTPCNYYQVNFSANCICLDVVEVESIKPAPPVAEPSTLKSVRLSVGELKFERLKILKNSARN